MNFLRTYASMEMVSVVTKRLLVSVVFVMGAHAKTINVVLASDSVSKQDAVRKAFEQRFPHDQVEVQAVAVASGIAAQPVGKENALKGIQNRLQHIPQVLLASADYCVGIENYIEPALYDGAWADVGYVVVVDTHTQDWSEVCSAPVYIPASYIGQLQQKSEQLSTGYSITAGQIIHQMIPNVNPHDWHADKQFGGVSRVTLLQDALFKALYKDALNQLRSVLTYHQDFPKKGILFVDFLPLLRYPQLLQSCFDMLAQRYINKKIDVIVGPESRGFLLGAVLADRLGVGFVPVRKPGKLPGEVYVCDYEKEYGHDTLTLAKDSLLPGQRVLIIDDLIATGNSARAAIKLVRMAGAEPVEFVSLLNVPVLQQKAQLDIPAFNLID